MLEGVTRDSVLSIVKGWSAGKSHGLEDGYTSSKLATHTQGIKVVERFLTMQEVIDASSEDRVSTSVFAFQFHIDSLIY